MSGIKYKSQILMPIKPTEPKHVVRLEDTPPVFLTQAQLAALEDPPESGLYPSLVNREVVVTDEDTALTAFEGMVPDYANRESQNRVTVDAKSVSWTADRTGFVYAQSIIHTTGAAQTAADSFISSFIRINSKQVAANASENMPGPYTRVYTDGVFQVTPGDLIEMFGSHTNSIAATAVGYGQYLYFIPPKVVSIQPPIVSEDFMNVAMVPDWPNRETDNKFSSAKNNFPGYVWTADRVGYVVLSYNLGEASPTSTYYINVFFGVREVNTYFFQNTLIAYEVIPVNVGDIVRINADSNKVWTEFSAECNFVPPKFITTQAPNIVVSGASYSATEQATGETWVDGKPIYRKVVYRNTGALSLTYDQPNILATGIYSTGYVSEVVKLSFSADNGGAFINGSPLYVDPANGYAVLTFIRPNGTLECKVDAAKTLNKLTVVVHYTKVAD
jgi:hypothetical protein